MTGSWNTNLWEKGYRFQIWPDGQDQQKETIRLDTPLALHLGTLFREFANDSSNAQSQAWAESLSGMMQREATMLQKQVPRL